MAIKLSVNDLILESVYELEKIEGLARILNVSINNLSTTANGTPAIKTEDSVYPYGEGLSELADVIVKRLNKLQQILKENMEDR